MNAFIQKIESFGLVDGPGVRFIVFLNGCAMRCRYCHNPETWKMAGTQRSAQDLLDQALRFKSYWGKKGGITVSGGEPLLQIDFLIDFFEKAHLKGVNTCIDTAGQPFAPENEKWMKKFERLMRVTDCVLLDLKEIDDKKHQALTACGNENILKLATWLSDHDIPVWIRHVLVPGVTDDEESLFRLRDFIRGLKNVHRVENLPYHSLGEVKYASLGIPYTLLGQASPTAEQKQLADEILEVEKYTRYLQ
ncbi:MAG: pyruvate formate lyase-activating protein [Opitutales bacterium]|nr:pyruvate formate lyase-activating protein [Opitutales bacterium]